MTSLSSAVFNVVNLFKHKGYNPACHTERFERCEQDESLEGKTYEIKVLFLLCVLGALRV